MHALCSHFFGVNNNNKFKWTWFGYIWIRIYFLYTYRKAVLQIGMTRQNQKLGQWKVRRRIGERFEDCRRWGEWHQHWYSKKVNKTKRPVWPWRFQGTMIMICGNNFLLINRIRGQAQKVWKHNYSQSADIGQ